MLDLEKAESIHASFVAFEQLLDGIAYWLTCLSNPAWKVLESAFEVVLLRAQHSGHSNQL